MWTILINLDSISRFFNVYEFAFGLDTSNLRVKYGEGTPTHKFFLIAGFTCCKNWSYFSQIHGIETSRDRSQLNSAQAFFAVPGYLDLIFAWRWTKRKNSLKTSQVFWKGWLLWLRDGITVPAIDQPKDEKECAGQWASSQRHSVTDKCIIHERIISHVGPNNNESIQCENIRQPMYHHCNNRCDWTVLGEADYKLLGTSLVWFVTLRMLFYQRLKAALFTTNSIYRTEQNNTQLGAIPPEYDRPMQWPIQLNSIWQ